MKRTILIGMFIALAGVALLGSSQKLPVVEAPHVAAGALNAVIDVDRPPASVNVLYGGTITLVKQGGSSTQNIMITTYGTDGGGELLIKLPGGPIGTVATLRPLRKGRGVIQVRLPASPGGRSFYTINVFVY